MSSDAYKIAEAMNERFCEALSVRDMDTLMEYYADDVQLLSAGVPPIVGADAVRAYWAQVHDAGVTGAESTTTHVEQSGDLLIVHGTYTVSLDPPGGEPMKDTGKFLVVHRKDAEGRWRCWFDMAQADGAAGTL